jgi:hypothetical protein
MTTGEGVVASIKYTQLMDLLVSTLVIHMFCISSTQGERIENNAAHTLAAKGLRSREVAIFLLNTPMVAWDPNADPEGPHRNIALKNHGDTGLGRWEVREMLQY